MRLPLSIILILIVLAGCSEEPKDIPVSEPMTCKDWTGLEEEMQETFDGLVKEMEADQPGWDVVTDVFAKANVGDTDTLQPTELKLVDLMVEKVNFMIAHDECYSDAVMSYINATPARWPGFWHN